MLVFVAAGASLDRSMVAVGPGPHIVKLPSAQSFTHASWSAGASVARPSSQIAMYITMFFATKSFAPGISIVVSKGGKRSPVSWQYVEPKRVQAYVYLPYTRCAQVYIYLYRSVKKTLMTPCWKESDGFNQSVSQPASQSVSQSASQPVYPDRARASQPETYQENTTTIRKP